MKMITREMILNTAEARLISKSTAEDYDAPYISRNFLDLVEVYYFKPFGTGDAYTRVSKEMLEAFGISEGELISTARERMLSRTYYIENIMAKIANLTGFPTRELPDEPPYVIATRDGFYDAIALTDGIIIAEAYEKVGGDIYILPSSVHELLVLPVEGNDVNELKEMVYTINRQEVTPKERLSDSVYKFDGHDITVY